MSYIKTDEQRAIWNDRYQRALNLMNEHYYNQSNIHLACLSWMFATMIVLHEDKINSTPQAGSCFWPMRLKDNPKLDREDINSFGYKWSPHEMPSVPGIIEGYIPEIHAWVGLPEDQVFIDFSSGYFPQAAKDSGYPTWLGPKPPKYFVGDNEDRKKLGCVYDCNREATLYAVEIMTASPWGHPLESTIQ